MLLPVLSFATMPSPLSPSLVDAVVKQDYEPRAMKQCSKCRESLSIESFNKDSRLKDGTRNYCKSCQAKAKRSWYVNGGGREVQKKYVKENPVLVMTVKMVRNARERAKEKNVPFDIDLDYIRSIVGENAERASHCPVLGTLLDWSVLRGKGSGGIPNSPSLDRIDPSKGYVKGNVWVISYRANTIKNDATHEELKRVTAAVGIALANSLDW